MIRARATWRRIWRGSTPCTTRRWRCWAASDRSFSPCITVFWARWRGSLAATIRRAMRRRRPPTTLSTARCCAGRPGCRICCWAICWRTRSRERACCWFLPGGGRRATRDHGTAPRIPRSGRRGARGPDSGWRAAPGRQTGGCCPEHRCSTWPPPCSPGADFRCRMIDREG